MTDQPVPYTGMTTRLRLRYRGRVNDGAGPWLPYSGRPPTGKDSPWLYVLGTVLMIVESLFLIYVLYRQ